MAGLPLLIARDPELVIAGEQIVWRVPIHFQHSFFGMTRNAGPQAKHLDN